VARTWVFSGKEFGEIRNPMGLPVPHPHSQANFRLQGNFDNGIKPRYNEINMTGVQI